MIFLCVVSALFSISCRNQVIDLTELDVNTYPNINGTVISPETPVWIEFSEDVEHAKTEKNVAVKNFSGSVGCDTTWIGNRLILTPLEGWTPGVIYTLSCSGTIETTDNLTFTVGESVSFYASSTAMPPSLVSWTPVNDGIIERNGTVTLDFSKAIASGFLEQFITVSPDHDITLTLSGDGRSVVIAPVGEWAGLTRYQWNVSSELLDTEGIKVRKDYSGYFRTQTDTIAPENPTVWAVDALDPSVKRPLEETGLNMGLLFEFNEPIDFEVFKKRLKTEPSLTMAYRIVNDASIIAYPPEASWVPGQEYKISLLKGISDTAGNETTEDYVFTLTAAIPVLSVVSITNSPETPQENFLPADFESVDPLKFGVNNGDLQHFFDIKFSAPISQTEAERLVAAINLEGVFPNYVTSPTLLLATVMAGDTLHLQYADFTLPEASKPYERVYYKLTINGGKQGFTLDNGSQLADDFILKLEAIKE